MKIKFYPVNKEMIPIRLQEVQSVECTTKVRYVDSEEEFDIGYLVLVFRSRDDLIVAIPMVKLDREQVETFIDELFYYDKLSLKKFYVYLNPSYTEHSDIVDCAKEAVEETMSFVADYMNKHYNDK